MKYNFSQSRAFAVAFAWDEVNNGRRAKVRQINGNWLVEIPRDDKRAQQKRV